MGVCVYYIAIDTKIQVSNLVEYLRAVPENGVQFVKAVQTVVKATKPFVRQAFQRRNKHITFANQKRQLFKHPG